VSTTQPSHPQRVVLLGATGSIGQNALRVVEAHPEHLQLVGAAAQSNHQELCAIAQRHPALRHMALFDETAATAARDSGQVPAGVSVGSGLSGLEEVATLPEADIVLCAVVGTTGLQPSLAALAAGKDLALASKEILVMAGKFVMAAAREQGVSLRPVDSEHNAVQQCLADHPTRDLARIVLTASGGAFRDRPLAELEHVTPTDALQHPNWSMGPKITVDSATMANKGLELIEAHWLFDLAPDQCQALLHRGSLAHCIVEFTDGAMLTHLCPPSMTFPIQHALLSPLRLPPVDPPLDLTESLTLDFAPLDPVRYPLLGLAHAAMHSGGTAPAIYNAANEVAVAAFLDGQISFPSIARFVEQTLEKVVSCDPPDLATVIAHDDEARQTARSLLTSA
jgi:1-deoxy-D-xylulose-5-phosphate reductoisomerase